ncbi:hypothetical protein D3C72_2490470 [compost metagenome]
MESLPTPTIVNAKEDGTFAQGLGTGGLHRRRGDYSQPAGSQADGREQERSPVYFR